MYRLLERLLQPYTLCLVLTGAALLALWWKRKESRRKLLAVTIPFALLVVLSLPLVSYYAMGAFEWSYSPLETMPEESEAIVVLLSGYQPPRGDFAAELESDTLYRCVEAARLYRQRPCPMVVTGGKADPTEAVPSGAEVMRDFLRQMGVAASDILVDPEGHTTYQNALGSKKLLDERGIHRVVLVTEAVHMRRSEWCFQKQGFTVTPAPCHFRTNVALKGGYALTPSPQAALDVVLAAHEFMGLTWYWLTGRIG